MLFLKTLFLARARSERSTPFINLLYCSIPFGCFTLLSTIHQRFSPLGFLVTVTVSFALSIVVNNVTTLLSFHCITKHSSVLSHLMAPRSFPFAQDFPPFIFVGNPLRFSVIVPVAGVCLRNKFFRRIGDV